jgi:hypothetical protein
MLHRVQWFLPEFGAQFLLEIREQLFHDGVSLVVGKRFGFILNDETYRVRFLAGF